MNISLERLIDAMITTLRTDVVPHIDDDYARGQVIGIIDLLNNIEPRIEWAREPVLAEIDEKRRLLHAVASRLDIRAAGTDDTGQTARRTTAELLEEKARLDSDIGDVIATLTAGDAQSTDSEQALEAVRAYLREEAEREMRLTRKPLFAEIASGKKAEAASDTSDSVGDKR